MADVDVAELQLQEDDKALVLACDGLWDVFTPPEVRFVFEPTKTLLGVWPLIPLGHVSTCDEIGC